MRKAQFLPSGIYCTKEEKAYSFYDSIGFLWFSFITIYFCSIVGTSAMTCLWKPKDNFVEVVSSFHLYLGSGDRTRVTWLARQSPSPPPLSRWSTVHRSQSCKKQMSYKRRNISEKTPLNTHCICTHGCSKPQIQKPVPHQVTIKGRNGKPGRRPCGPIQRAEDHR